MNPMLYGVLSGGVGAPWGWEEIVPSSGSEPSGDRGGAIFLGDSSYFYLIGGGTATDYWRFDRGTKVWTQVVASGLAPVANSLGFVSGGYAYYTAKSISFVNSYSFAGQRLTLSSGAASSLSSSGSGSSSTQWVSCADPTTGAVYSAEVGAFDYKLNGNFSGGSGVFLKGTTSGTTTTITNLTSAATGRLSTCLSYHPDTNTIYSFAPSVAYTATWTLSVSDILKYDLTAATGWAAETGVTNSAGSLVIPSWPNAFQMVWWPAEAKFFIFTKSATGGAEAIGSILTYDPVTKIISNLYYSGSPGTKVLGYFDGYGASRGEMGTVVVQSDGIYFARVSNDTGLTNARIWKFRRNY